MSHVFSLQSAVIGKMGSCFVSEKEGAESPSPMTPVGVDAASLILSQTLGILSTNQLDSDICQG
jgi:hypothetical protein